MSQATSDTRIDPLNLRRLAGGTVGPVEPVHSILDEGPPPRPGANLLAISPTQATVILSCLALFFQTASQMVLLPTTTPFTVLSLACTGGVVAINFNRLGFVLNRVWPMLLILAVFWASIVWSQIPGATLRTLLFTTLYWASALVTVSVLNMRSVLRCVVIAMTAIVVINLPMAAVQAGGALNGFFGSKNHLAGISVTGLVCALSMVFSSLVGARERLILVAAASVMFITMIMAQSAGAVVSLGIGIAALFATQIIGNSRGGSRVILFSLIMLAGLILLLLMPYFRGLYEWMIVDILGKDLTLTGRSEIWDQADRLIEARPWLGLGRGAFWDPSNPDAVRIYRWAGIAELQGFNFHNEWYEVAVGTGYLGVGVFFIVLTSAMLLHVRHLLTTNPPGISAVLAVTVAAILRMSAESGALDGAAGSSVFLMLLAKAFVGERTLEPPSAPISYVRHRR
jgi:exopolysaccharide production protein ExoQ